MLKYFKTENQNVSKRFLLNYLKKVSNNIERLKMKLNEVAYAFSYVRLDQSISLTLEKFICPPECPRSLLEFPADLYLRKAFLLQVPPTLSQISVRICYNLPHSRQCCTCSLMKNKMGEGIAGLL